MEILDCIGHVQKRMGKYLNLKSTTKGKLDDGQSIGGAGRLTKANIKQLQKYLINGGHWNFCSDFGFTFKHYPS